MRELEMNGAERALAILRTSGRERDVEMWAACLDVVRSLERYREAEFVLPEELRSKQGWLAGLRNLADDAFETSVHADPVAFGLFRVAVWDHEAINARRLQVLVWVLQTLYRLRDLPDAHVDVLDPLASKLGDVLMFEWRLKDVPLQGSARDWATRKARRYDLLPKHWRWV